MQLTSITGALALLVVAVAALPQPLADSTVYPEKPQCPSGQRPKAVSDATCSCDPYAAPGESAFDATKGCCGGFEGAQFISDNQGPICVWDAAKWTRNAPSKFQNCCAKQHGIKDPSNMVCGTMTAGYICVDEK